MILRDIRKGRTIISGNTVIICEELEEIIRKVHESFINSLGEEGAKSLTMHCFPKKKETEKQRKNARMRMKKYWQSLTLFSRKS